MQEVLVIGFGNTLRRDDAVAPMVAEVVSRWQRPGVIALALPQLFPELAERLSHVSRVIFVDAAIYGDNRVEALTSDPGEPTLHHTCDPRSLLALTQALYSRCPPAWLISISVADLGYGEGISACARAGLQFAVEQVQHLLRISPPITPADEGVSPHPGRR